MEKPDSFHSEIDIRGLNVEEALPQIELFFDEAIMAGFNVLRIIHGKGTGKLRTGVVAFLKSHSRVKSLRLGNWNEGSTGVTVVELK
jgi:DNA mismatch repair protein MutS2